MGRVMYVCVEFILLWRRYGIPVYITIGAPSWKDRLGGLFRTCVLSTVGPLLFFLQYDTIRSMLKRDYGGVKANKQEGAMILY